MKTTFTYIFVFLNVYCISQALHEVDFKNTGEVIYLLNPFTTTQEKCVDSIKLNNVLINTADSSTAFALNPNDLNFKIGDKLNLKIYHDENCLPKILSNNWGHPKSTFEVDNISIDSNKILYWTTSNEHMQLTYIIEQYRWNKWIKIGEVDGNGLITENHYQFEPIYHSGINKFRVKQIDYTGKPRISESIEFNNGGIESPILMFNPPSKVIEFSSETFYEVFDSDGSMLYKGYGIEINMKKNKKGLYYLNYDNHIGEVINIK